MTQAQHQDRRALAWTVAGAVAGSSVRHWIELCGVEPFGVGPLGPDFGWALGGTFALIGAAAAVIGFAMVAAVRQVLRTAMAAVGGAAGSISAAAAGAATDTPMHSVIGLAVFYGAAVGGLLVGMLVGRAVSDSARRERC